MRMPKLSKKEKAEFDKLFTDEDIETIENALGLTDLPPSLRNLVQHLYARQHVDKADRLNNAGRPPKWTDEEILYLRELVSYGWPIARAAREIGMPYRYAWNVIRGYRRADVGDYAKVGFRQTGWQKTKSQPNGIDEPHPGCMNTMYGNDVRVNKIKWSGEDGKAKGSEQG